MPVYRYKALDSTESLVTGVVEAADSKEARQRLSGDSLFLLDLRSASAERPGPALGATSRRGTGELALVTRQFATLAKAGIPLADALDAMVDMVESPKLQIVVRDLKECVTGGMSLEEALRRHPPVFSPFYISMVKVGEASGNMNLVLERLSEYLHTQARVRGKIRNAMTYPVLMLMVGAAVLTFLIAFVVPKITDILLESGRGLPVPTTILIGISSALTGYWWAIALVAALLVGGYRAIVRTEGGRLARDTFLLSLPVLGTLLKKSLISRFSLAFATLLRSGLPAVESLMIVKEAAGNKVLEQTLEEIHDRIIEGQDISEIMKQSGVFPPLVAYMIAVGERSGRLEEMLGIISEYYDEEIDSATARFTAVLEPVMIIALAVIVGFVVLGVILPIMEMGRVV